MAMPTNPGHLRPVILKQVGRSLEIRKGTCSLRMERLCRRDENAEIADAIMWKMPKILPVWTLAAKLPSSDVQKNPRAHKNKIGASPPKTNPKYPPKQTQSTPQNPKYPPKKTRNFMGMEVFL